MTQEEKELIALLDLHDLPVEGTLRHLGASWADRTPDMCRYICKNIGTISAVIADRARIINELDRLKKAKDVQGRTADPYQGQVGNRRGD